MSTLYNPNQRKIILLGLLIVLGAFVLFALRGIFTAIIGAVIIYTLFKPTYQHLAEKQGWNGSLVAILIIILSFIILVIPFFTLTWLLVEKIIQFQNDPSAINEIIKKLDRFFGAELNQPDLVPSTLEKLETWVTGTFTSVVVRVLNIFLQIAVMYFILFFMFIHHERFENTLLKYVPFPEKNAVRLATEFKNITYSSVLGQGLIALTQGSLLTIGFLIFGIRDPVFWGIVAMLFAFIPFVGPPFVFFPAGLIAISAGNTGAGIGIMIYGVLLVSTIDNFMRFFIAKKVGNIHPLITVLGVIIGLPFFGIIGLVVGPLLLSYFILLLSLYENNYVKNVTLRKRKVFDIPD